MAEPEAKAPAPEVPATPAVVSAVTDAASKAASVVTEKAQETIAKTTEVVKETTAKYGLMVLVGIVVAVILFFIAYWLYLYLSTRLTNKLTTLIADTKVPRRGSEVSQISGGEFPPMTNGNRVTYSFWLYIHDISKFAGPEMRHVLHFGDEKLQGASPVVFLDGTLNKLYVRFEKTKGAATSFEDRVANLMKHPMNTPSTDDTNDKRNAGYENKPIPADKKMDAILIDLAQRGMVIDYVPLQRWVHVTIVVNETVNQGYMAAYLDGELVKTISSNDKLTLSSGRTIPVSFQNLNLAKSGSLYIGGDVYNSNINKGFSGMVSKVSISNYDLNGEEIKRIYVQGPMDNLTSKLGLPAYGLRSPVYRVG